MAHSPLTAVAVINHNYGRFLREAVSSVLQQTRVPSVLVLDDASSDDSAAVLASLEAASPALTVVRLTKNIGLSRVRNFAAARATTERIVFLDADDWLEPTYIEQAEAWLARSPSLPSRL